MKGVQKTETEKQKKSLSDSPGVLLIYKRY